MANDVLFIVNSKINSGKPVYEAEVQLGEKQIKVVASPAANWSQLVINHADGSSFSLFRQLDGDQVRLDNSYTSALGVVKDIAIDPHVAAGVYAQIMHAQQNRVLEPNEVAALGELVPQFFASTESVDPNRNR